MTEGTAAADPCDEIGLSPVNNVLPVTMTTYFWQVISAGISGKWGLENRARIKTLRIIGLTVKWVRAAANAPLIHTHRCASPCMRSHHFRYCDHVLPVDVMTDVFGDWLSGRIYSIVGWCVRRGYGRLGNKGMAPLGVQLYTLYLYTAYLWIIPHQRVYVCIDSYVWEVVYVRTST